MFHPAVTSWFDTALGTPTSAQQRGWAAIRDGRHTLIAAPTGSGKTLAAFLAAIDDLVQEGIQHPLPDEVRVVYVSPLKALSADIHKNLAEPRRGIRRAAEAMGLEAPRITAAVRTGDTTQKDRAAMRRTPPHILVTTPESLYLLLTSDGGRAMLRTTRTVIVDEIHAVIGTRRGAHLALSLERLEQLVSGPPEGGPHVPVDGPHVPVSGPHVPGGGPHVPGVEAGFSRPLRRIGLSATQNPVEEVARYLVGNVDAPLDGARGRRGDCAIIDEGHRRRMDLAIEIPRSALDAVMAHEVWEEYYDRLTELIQQHKTTLIFVNTRRMAERAARHLSERIGGDAVTAHHGSLSKETRLDAEHRLKTGALKALVATASLELGIDIGHVDLVIQIGSPHRIATLLQRVGRSGHSIAGMPKGRLMPTSRDDLVECAALLRAVDRGDLDRIVQHDAPLDVLSQQLAAEIASADYTEESLFALARRAWPYRQLARADFDAVVGMLSDGFATRRGHRAALVHRDEVHQVLRGRRASRLIAITSGGAIPEVADYRVVLDPDDTFIGTLNEDFAIESMAGDVFQLGNSSWRVLQVGAGTVRVADAQGAPPNIPFWLGEAPARSDELSREVSRLRAEADEAASAGADLSVGADLKVGPSVPAGYVPAGAAEQINAYFAEGRAALGVIPTQETLVLERFFDESGGMQLVLHAPFGNRINKAWALALRKRFCVQFNFELQAAATEDALLLSLGPQHSFPLADVFRYLHPATVRDILVQAFLDAPLFQTRWRWNATISLAVPRYRGGRKVAPQLQRMQANDLMAAVFPDAAACLDNIPGDRQIPSHPLVDQTIRDCLEEAMDIDGLIAVLERIHRGELRCVSRDTPEPSAFAHDILNARPYAFLDDAPLEERRVQAVQQRRAGAPTGGDLGALDAAAIERVRDEQRPDPRDADELHDALLSFGFLKDGEFDPALMAPLAAAARATKSREIWIAAERLPEWLAVHPQSALEPPIAPPPSRTAKAWTRAEALAELVRSRMGLAGPATACQLAQSCAVTEDDVETALLTLESDGAVLRGHFSHLPPTTYHLPTSTAPEWCDRRLLARIHRYTLNRLRAEIAPVAPSDFMRFLLAWQHVEPSARLTGSEGLRVVLAQLDGLELPARAWERDVLPARLDRYEPAMLDLLCLTGAIGWARLSSGPTQVVGATPIALFLREHAEMWLSLRDDVGGADLKVGPSKVGPHVPEGHAPEGGAQSVVEAGLSRPGAAVLEQLRTRGASFGPDLAAACGLDDDQFRSAIAELVAAGLVTSDAFAGLRSIVSSTGSSRGNSAGRWSALPTVTSRASSDNRQPATDNRQPTTDTGVELLAWSLLRRYGVICRRLLAREATAVPWRDLARVYRRLEARGEIRGGRFVSGLSGEQFALPDAVERLREIRRTAPDDRLLTISGADPLNLAGILTAGDRVRASSANRVVYRNGIPIAAMEGDMLRTLAVVEPDVAAAAAAAAAGRRVPVISGYVGRLG